MNKIMKLVSILLCGVFLSTLVQAQEATESAATEADASVTTPVNGEKNAGDKRMIRDATISLQTTVTGNQEQPRVMYILPWQSPLSPDLDIEMLDSQQEAVFGHVEREELQRSMEAAGEFDQDD